MIDDYTKWITIASILEIILSMILTLSLLIVNPYLFNHPIIMICIWYGFIALNTLFFSTLICGLLVAGVTFFHGLDKGLKYFVLLEPSITITNNNHSF